MLSDVETVFGMQAEAYEPVADDGNCVLDCITHALNKLTAEEKTRVEVAVPHQIGAELDHQALTCEACRRMCFHNVSGEERKELQEAKKAGLQGARRRSCREQRMRRCKESVAASEPLRFLNINEPEP